MKINHNLAAALILGLVSGAFKNSPSITSGNRIHTNRAPRGSASERDALERAAAKRARKMSRNRKVNEV